MNAKPLTDPEGVVRGWMCGCCLHPRANPEKWSYEADASLVGEWKIGAERCCTCRACGAPSEHLRGVLCKSCDEQWAMSHCDADEASADLVQSEGETR